MTNIGQMELSLCCNSLYLSCVILFQFVLSLSPEHLQSRNKSGGEILKRPLSSAKQDYDTDEKVWPVNKPIPKIEGLYQCSGNI